MTTNEEFAKRMMLLARPVEQFRPQAIYDQDGDCIEFLAKPDSFYAERVDDLVTVYYSQETNEVIGSLIKSVSRLTKELVQSFPGFRIVVEDGRVKLEHVFLARLWARKPDEHDLATLTYRKLAEVAEQAQVEAELCFA